MAAPITHILFAIEVHKNISRNFILGTSFPDIRYLGVIGRNTTHSYTLDSLTDTSSFISGMAFHQYVDIEREKYWQAQEVYNILPNSPYISQTLKFLEDIVLYENCEQWKSLSTCFDSIIDDERAFSISDIELSRWHQLIKEYVTNGPNLENIFNLTSQLENGEQITAAMRSILPELVNDKIIKDKIIKYYDLKKADFRVKIRSLVS